MDSRHSLASHYSGFIFFIKPPFRFTALVALAFLAACSAPSSLEPTGEPTPLFLATYTATPQPTTIFPATLSPTAHNSPTPPPSPTLTLEDYYTRLRREYPQIEEYIRFLQAREAMPPSSAIAELEALIVEYPTSPVGYEAHLLLARHTGSLGDPRAYDHYQAALSLESPPDMKLEWAHYLESTGRNGEAYLIYREVFRRFSNLALPALKRLAPDPLTLAQDLLNFGFPEDALAVLDTFEGGGSNAVLALRARVMMTLGRVEEALGTYDAWLAREPRNLDAQLGRARALSSLGRHEEALAILAPISTVSAQLTRSEILYALGRKEEALNIYLGLTDPVAKWRAAGILEELGRGPETLSLYEEVARSSSSLADDAAYRLWVLAGRVGDTERQGRAAALLGNFWPNYFTLLVRGTDFSAETAALPSPPDSVLSLLQKARALQAIGFPEWAIKELVFAARATDDVAADLHLGQALYELGAWREADRIGEGILSAPGPAPLLAWRLAYPKAYPDEVEAAAREFGLDPFLIWSVMRQESHYNPQAVSRSYAQGLMQIIPPTRDEIARALEVAVDWESAFDPALNIRFGVYYLSKMLERFEGDMEFAVAAYNGGGGTVSTTLGNPLVRSRADFYRWLVKAESREFINLVMLNYAIYRWLEGIEADSG